MQLRELQAQSEELQKSGVAVHFISAETGGADEIKKRLADRDSPIELPVHSDPEHKLLVHRKRESPNQESLYITVEHKAGDNYGGTYENYIMVQPALIVVDKTGKIQQVWSWNTPVLDIVTPKKELTFVAHVDGNPLVGVRPVSNDLAPSIKEGRNVALAGKSAMTIIWEGIEKDGFFTTMYRAMFV